MLSLLMLVLLLLIEHLNTRYFSQRHKAKAEAGVDHPEFRQALHDLFAADEAAKPGHTPAEIYADLADRLSEVAAERGVFFDEN